MVYYHAKSSKQTGFMQSFNDLTAALSSYGSALLALLGWIVIDHSSTWVGIAGFILLVSRLIVEVPKAYRILIPKGEQGIPGPPGPPGPPGKPIIVTVDTEGQVIPDRKWWKFGWPKF